MVREGSFPFVFFVPMLILTIANVDNCFGNLLVQSLYIYARIQKFYFV